MIDDLITEVYQKYNVSLPTTELEVSMSLVELNDDENEDRGQAPPKKMKMDTSN